MSNNKLENLIQKSIAGFPVNDLTDFYQLPLKSLDTGGEGNISIGKTLDGEIEVIKEYHQGIDDDLKNEDYTGAITRFKREIKGLTRLGEKEVTPKIKRAFLQPDPKRGKSIPTVAMELVEGKTLSQLKSENYKFDEEKTIDLLIGVLQNVKEIHNEGFLHRDLHPGNIKLVSNEISSDRRSYKIIDLASSTELNKKTRTIAIGTLEYAAPEQWDGENNKVTEASDIYSIGKIAKNLSSENSNKLKNILDKMTQKEISLRYKNASEVLNDLEKLRKVHQESNINKNEKENLSKHYLQFNNGFGIIMEYGNKNIKPYRSKELKGLSKYIYSGTVGASAAAAGSTISSKLLNLDLVSRMYDSMFFEVIVGGGAIGISVPLIYDLIKYSYKNFRKREKPQEVKLEQRVEETKIEHTPIKTQIKVESKDTRTDWNIPEYEAGHYAIEIIGSESISQKDKENLLKNYLQNNNLTERDKKILNEVINSLKDENVKIKDLRSYIIKLVNENPELIFGYNRNQLRYIGFKIGYLSNLECIVVSNETSVKSNELSNMMRKEVEDLLIYAKKQNISIETLGDLFYSLRTSSKENFVSFDKKVFENYLEKINKNELSEKVKEIKEKYKDSKRNLTDNRNIALIAMLEDEGFRYNECQGRIEDGCHEGNHFELNGNFNSNNSATFPLSQQIVLDFVITALGLLGGYELGEHIRENFMVPGTGFEYITTLMGGYLGFKFSGFTGKQIDNIIYKVQEKKFEGEVHRSYSRDEIVSGVIGLFNSVKFDPNPDEMLVLEMIREIERIGKETKNQLTPLEIITKVKEIYNPSLEQQVEQNINESSKNKFLSLEVRPSLKGALIGGVAAAGLELGLNYIGIPQAYEIVNPHSITAGAVIGYTLGAVFEYNKKEIQKNNSEKKLPNFIYSEADRKESMLGGEGISPGYNTRPITTYERTKHNISNLYNKLFKKQETTTQEVKNNSEQIENKEENSEEKYGLVKIHRSKFLKLNK